MYRIVNTNRISSKDIPLYTGCFAPQVENRIQLLKNFDKGDFYNKCIEEARVHMFKYVQLSNGDKCFGTNIVDFSKQIDDDSCKELCTKS
jgi:hypothetical protein